MKIDFTEIEKRLLNLNEGEQLQAEQTSQKKENLIYKAFEKDAQYQYILQRKKEALPVNLVLPNKFDLPVRLPSAPEDINNIMSSYKNNKARKTQNIGGVMQDPIKTYDLAEACCSKAFGNFFGKEIAFEKDEKQRTVNHAYIKKSNESYNYEEFPTLNESATAFAAGHAIGTGIGAIAGEVISAGGGALLGLAGTVGVKIAALGTSAYMLGYFGEELFGNVESGGISNDKVAAHLNAASQKMLNPTPAEPEKYKNIVEAIESYVKDIMEAVGDIAGLLNPEGAAKIDDTEKFVIRFMNTSSKKAVEFINTHSKEIEDEKELQRTQKELENKKALNKSEKIKNFIKQTQNLWAKSSRGQSGKESFIILQKIQAEYEKNPNNTKSIELESAAEDGWEQLVNVYNKILKDQKQNKDEESESFNLNYTNKLNEDDATSEFSGIENKEHDRKPKLVINANKIYVSLLQELEQRFREAFPKNLDAKKLPRYEETKQQMQDLIDAADKSINAKIDQITKIQSGESAGTGGLSQAAKTFLIGHPLESNNLREVWSRHLVDLKSRMASRLQQMTDTNNKTRTLGWILQVCRTVVPEIIARMLTYRYIYAILSNKGFFSYDTPTMEADKKAFEADKDIYINSPKAKLIWILNNICGDYCINEEQLLTEDPQNGGWILSTNSMVYAFFLMSKLYGPKSNAKTLATLGEFLAHIKSFVQDKDQVDQFIGTILTALQESGNDALLNDENPEKFEELVNLFQMPDEIKSLKEEIKSTFELLRNAKIPTDRDTQVNVVKSLDIISQHPRDIYTKYVENEGLIKQLINNKNDKDKVKSEIVKIFGNCITEENEKVINSNNYNDVTADFIKKILPANQSHDYYASILYMYPLQGLNVWDDSGKLMKQSSPEAVKQVCKVVSKLLDFEMSGILAYVLDEKDEDQERKNAETLQELSNKIKITYNDFIGLKKVTIAISKLGDKLNNNEKYKDVKQNYTELYNQVKEQMKTAYQSVIGNSKYVISGILGGNNNLLEADGNSDNSSDWFKELVSKATQFNANSDDAEKVIENFKTGLNSIKVSPKGQTNNIIEFKNETLTDNDRNQILLDLCNAVEKVFENEEVQNLMKTLNDIFNIDAEVANEKDFEKLKNAVNIIKELYEIISVARKKTNEKFQSAIDEANKGIYRGLYNALENCLQEILKEAKNHYEAINKDKVRFVPEVFNIKSFNDLGEILLKYKDLNADTLEIIKNAFGKNIDAKVIKNDKSISFSTITNKKIQNQLIIGYITSIDSVKTNCNAYDDLMTQIEIINKQK